MLTELSSRCAWYCQCVPCRHGPGTRLVVCRRRLSPSRWTRKTLSCERTGGGSEFVFLSNDQDLPSSDGASNRRTAAQISSAAICGLLPSHEPPWDAILPFNAAGPPGSRAQRERGRRVRSRRGRLARSDRSRGLPGSRPGGLLARLDSGRCSSAHVQCPRARTAPARQAKRFRGGVYTTL